MDNDMICSECGQKNGCWCGVDPDPDCGAEDNYYTPGPIPEVLAPKYDTNKILGTCPCGFQWSFKTRHHVYQCPVVKAEEALEAEQERQNQEADKRDYEARWGKREKDYMDQKAEDYQTMQNMIWRY